MPGRLEGRVAWISGGASGIGEGVARLFSREGAKIAIIDVQVERGRRLQAEIPGSYFIECDVRRELSVRLAIDEAADHFGGLQIIVNCAGIVHVKPLHEYSEAEWDTLMDVNVKSIFFSVKHGLPHLKRGPRSYVVNIGSVGSFIGQPNTPAYTTSKGAVLQLSRSIALDYAADGIRCNCVCPGITDTPMLRFHMSAAPDPEAAFTQRLRRVPMGVTLYPEDIARAVLYFSCEDSSGITGTSLVVDGGYLAAAEWTSPPQTAFMDAPPRQAE